jgi:Glycosyl transferase family 2
MLPVVICTHNPHASSFPRVLAAIGRQTCPKDSFELVIVDNRSTPPITEALCRPYIGCEVRLRIVREEELGIGAARVRAIDTTTGAWLLFVDDDTEIMPDYIEQGLRIIGEAPQLGCFGGKLLLPDDLVPPDWARPLLGFLAIKDDSDTPITALTSAWGPWEPPTAGAFVRREVLNRFRCIFGAEEQARRLGRKGRTDLISGEDGLMMKGACVLGLAMSYQPALRLVHHINPRRLEFRTMLRLMEGHGRARAILERLVAQTPVQLTPAPDEQRGRLWRVLRQVATEEIGSSLRYACCMLAFRTAYVAARLPEDVRDALAAVNPLSVRNMRSIQGC